MRGLRPRGARRDFVRVQLADDGVVFGDVAPEIADLANDLFHRGANAGVSAVDGFRTAQHLLVHDEESFLVGEQALEANVAELVALHDEIADRESVHLVAQVLALHVTRATLPFGDDEELQLVAGFPESLNFPRGKGAKVARLPDVEIDGALGADAAVERVAGRARRQRKQRRSDESCPRGVHCACLATL